MLKIGIIFTGWLIFSFIDSAHVYNILKTQTIQPDRFIISEFCLNHSQIITYRIKMDQSFLAILLHTFYEF